MDHNNPLNVRASTLLIHFANNHLNVVFECVINARCWSIVKEDQSQNLEGLLMSSLSQNTFPGHKAIASQAVHRVE